MLCYFLTNADPAKMFLLELGIIVIKLCAAGHDVFVQRGHVQFLACHSRSYSHHHHFIYLFIVIPFSASSLHNQYVVDHGGNVVHKSCQTLPECLKLHWYRIKGCIVIVSVIIIYAFASGRGMNRCIDDNVRNPCFIYNFAREYFETAYGSQHLDGHYLWFIEYLQQQKELTGIEQHCLKSFF